MTDVFDTIPNNLETILPIVVACVAGVLSIFTVLMSMTLSTRRLQHENKHLLSQIEEKQKQKTKSESNSSESNDSGAETVLNLETTELIAKEHKEQFDKKIESLITDHHEQALKEARIQFWCSIFSAGIGLILIGIAIMLCFAKDAEWYINLIATICGLITEAISVLFLSQSKQTREQSSDFLNRLREDRKYEKGIEISNTIEDNKLKAKMLATIALHLCGISDSILHEASNNQEETDINSSESKENRT